MNIFKKLFTSDEKLEEAKRPERITPYEVDHDLKWKAIGSDLFWGADDNGAYFEEQRLTYKIYASSQTTHRVDFNLNIVDVNFDSKFCDLEDIEVTLQDFGLPELRVGQEVFSFEIIDGKTTGNFIATNEVKGVKTTVSESIINSAKSILLFELEEKSSYSLMEIPMENKVRAAEFIFCQCTELSTYLFIDNFNEFKFFETLKKELIENVQKLTNSFSSDFDSIKFDLDILEKLKNRQIKRVNSF